MNEHERTRDIYELNDKYPQPPLVPIAELYTDEFFEDLGIQNKGWVKGVTKAVISLIGFGRYYSHFPEVMETALRRINQRGPMLYAPVISATMALLDDPRPLSPIERATTLILAARQFYEAVMSGELPPDELRGQPLEMGQYPNFFGTSLIMDGKQFRIFKSKLASQITVIVARRIYLLTIADWRAESLFNQVRESLQWIAEDACHHRPKWSEPAPGIITAASNLVQYRSFGALKRYPANSQNLELLRHSLFTVCLDLDSYPLSYARAAFLAHATNFDNRWFHSSLQFIIFGNARACTYCNFSTYLDGNTMMRGAAEMQRRACQISVPSPSLKNGPAQILPIKMLEWRVPMGCIQPAQRDIQLILDNQEASFKIDGIGKAFFEKNGCEPVPTFILALQLATLRLTGEMAKIEQFLTMTKYRCMDLVTAIVTTPEVIRFSEYVEKGQWDLLQAQSLLKTAIDSQSDACRKARRFLPANDIFGLFILSKKKYVRLLILCISAIFIKILKQFGAFKLAKGREIIVSHPEIYPEVPIVGRPGIRLPYVKYYGLHYQIFDDQIIVTMMPGINWRVSNAEFFAELQRSLHLIKQIIGAKVGAGDSVASDHTVVAQALN
ncbi:MAG: choline/carnitine O-acyltransferase [candidate division KSB1 bacterium]|nr:choline/carnitine O-acyltransferase [candidate division KSB1 bacterium]